VKKKKNGFTNFQLRVLEETLKIPLGKVRTYSWIARRLHSPQAMRAVGSALRKNPYPLLIPCHRVVRAEGDIGGYSSGKAVKKKLLEFEKRLKYLFYLNRKKSAMISITAEDSLKDED
jgi:O-6-methylguanine DNA methyltransferase